MKQEIITRITSIYFLVALIAVAIVVRMLYIQIFEKSKWEAKEKTIDYKEIEATRGNIYSEDGKVLAVSVPYYRVLMDFASSAFKRELFHQKVDSLASSLSELFGDKSTADYALELITAEQKRKAYHLLHSKVTYNQLKKLKNFPFYREGRFSSGLITEPYSKRVKPHNHLSARIIGYISASENVNTVGIEGAYNSDLRGVNGMRLMQKLPGNDMWMPLNYDNEVEPVDGKDVISTLNVNMMEITETALLKQLKYLEAKHGTAILMEVETGDIKAMANLSRTEDGKYQESYNFAIGQSSEPGSTIKLATLISLLEDEKVNLNDMVNTQGGEIKFGDFTIKDSQKGGYGNITVKQAFEHSSNVAFAKLMWKYYKDNPEEFVDRLYNIGLNKKAGIEVRGEGLPYIKYPGEKHWYKVSLPQMSIGYELRITPLQTLMLYNAIANNGKMMKPRFVKEIREFSHADKKINSEVINSSICSQKTIEKVKLCLEGVVERGTATNIKNSKFRIAGKTGTAQMANAKFGYETELGKSYQASFAGYFPAEKPKYSCIVVIYAPQKISYYGSGAAAPVFGEIAENVYATALDIHKEVNSRTIGYKRKDNIPFSKNGYKKEIDFVFRNINSAIQNNSSENANWIMTRNNNEYVEYQTVRVSKNKVPSVRGMCAKDALYILENAGLTVELKGRGTVAKQSIEAGQNFTKGQKIIIELI